MTEEVFYGILSGFVGGFISGYIDPKLIERERKVTLRFSRIIIQQFPKSARIILEVKNEGKLSVYNAVGYLTIEVDGRPQIPKDLVIRKGTGFCNPIPAPARRFFIDGTCEFCDFTGYLVPEESPEVLSEPLCWTTPIYVGEGLQDYKYNHVTHIPGKGSAKLCLFDLYKIKFEDKLFYMIRVFSEYGVKHYPRICLKLDLQSSLRITFKIVVSGENIRKPAEAVVKIKRKKSRFRFNL